MVASYMTLMSDWESAALQNHAHPSIALNYAHAYKTGWAFLSSVHSAVSLTCIETTPPPYCFTTRYCSLGHTVVPYLYGTQEMTLSFSRVCSHTCAPGSLNHTAVLVTHNSCKKEAGVVASDTEMQVHNKPVFVHLDEIKLLLCARMHK